jgi:HAD superfamily hydrolase (TIGR01509 family)
MGVPTAISRVSCFNIIFFGSSGTIGNDRQCSQGPDMRKTTLLFGSIGVLMETSDVQRRAYNRALKEAGLNWLWTREIYAELLTQSGGQDRLKMLASATGTPLSQQQIESIHSRKTTLACDELASTITPLRPGVAALLKWAKTQDLKLGFVTSTNQSNIDAIFDTSGGALRKSDFDYIGSNTQVARAKPWPEAYVTALNHLGVAPAQALAIEDTAVSLMAAKRAGLQVVATPGDISSGQDFWQADLYCDSLIDANGHIDARVMNFLMGDDRS